jgi:hypothetical protein
VLAHKFVAAVAIHAAIVVVNGYEVALGVGHADAQFGLFDDRLEISGSCVNFLFEPLGFEQIDVLLNLYF